MGRLGVDILLYSVAWVQDPDSQWFARDLPAVARAQGFHIVAANWTVPADPAPAWHGGGQSRIIDSSGNILASAGEGLEADIVYAELPIPVPVAAESPPPSAPPGGPRLPGR